jgi:Isochorismatase family
MGVPRDPPVRPPGDAAVPPPSPTRIRRAARGEGRGPSGWYRQASNPAHPAASLPVVHIQHCARAGEVFAEGALGWLIFEPVEPEGSEPVVRKRAADAFGETDLHARLQQMGARRLVVAGIQTEHCVAATCRAALQLGYEVYLAEDGHSTWPDQVRSAREIMTAESEKLKAAGVTLCSTEDLLNLLGSWRVTDP